MNQTMIESGQPNRSKVGRFGLILAAAVVLYIVAIMAFIVAY